MKTYLITGATGYIGSVITKFLLFKKLVDQSEIRIYALVRNINRAKLIFPDGIDLIQADITNSETMYAIKKDFDYIIHCASITKSAQMISNPVETANGIVYGTYNILELAKRCKIKSMVYLSSMEVYGNIDCSDGHKVSEEELGTIDIFQTRSCYPLGKRMAEHYCYAYYKEYGVPVKIARLAQTFGIGLLPGESRVFAQFARSVYKQRNIVLHTEGKSVGNYCDIQEAVEAIMILLDRGVNGEAYNVVNENNTMTIKQLAELVADRVSEGKICVVYDIMKEKKCGYAVNTGVRLSAAKLNDLGWKPVKGLDEMFKDVIDCLRVIEN
jgi:nucleoside-diphosphate-sugar epimerase